MKNLLIAVAVIMMAFSLSACQKKEEAPKAEKSSMAKGPIIDTRSGSAPHGTGQKTEFQVVVPDEIKDAWESVVFVIEDKKENSRQEVTARVGDEFKIPGSNLTVTVGPFLPDFKMSASTITSVTNDPKNPAVGVAISENGQKLFPATGEWGWLYMNFPTIHSFQHERFGLVLKEGVKK